MKNFIQRGDTLSFTAAAAASSGDLINLGSGLHGVAAYDVAVGDEGEAVIEGVFELPKVAADVAAAFDLAYFDGSNITTDPSGNTLVGVFTQAAAASTLSAAIKLLPTVS